MAERRRGRVDEATWAAIMQAWVETPDSVRAIGLRFNVHPTTIRDHAYMHGWPERPVLYTRKRVLRPAPPPPTVGLAMAARAGTSPVATGEASEGDPAGEIPGAPSLARREPDSQEVRVLRLLRVIDMQIDNMERLMSSGEALSPQDQERHARTLTATLGNLEKTTETAKEVLKAEARTDGEAGHERTEADRMRREIAERLERLSEKWLAQSKSE